MDYKMLCFFPPYNKSQFYQLMGFFFAERIYQKMYPYLVNTPKTYWYVVVDSKNVVQAFSSFEKKKNKIEIGDIYQSSRIKKDIKRILLRKMLLDIRNYDQAGVIEACVNNLEDKRLFELKGFSVFKKTKNYYFLKKEVSVNEKN
ncbi:TPA: hypothetical protein ACOBTX_001434 [Enterococcus faecium]